MNEELARLGKNWEGRIKSIQKNIAASEARMMPAPITAAPARFSAPETGLKSQFEELKQSLAEFAAEWGKNRPAAASVSGPDTARIDARLGALEKQCEDFRNALSEVQKIESFMKDARQKQYETFVEDRGKLRVDYLDLKQEVTQKLKIMQLRIEDLLAASAAQSFKAVDAPEGEAHDVSHLSSIAGTEEKGFLQRLAEWWNEPVLSFSKDEPKDGPTENS